MAYWTVLCTAHTGDPKAFGITLDTALSTWIANGPAANRLFLTKNGRFDFHVLPTLGTTLVDDKKRNVCEIDGLNARSEVGDNGTGTQQETGNTFGWRLDSK